MSKKKNEVNVEELLALINSQNVETRDVRKIGQDSYLEYAMAVIIARALPDVRDGLKPVHRRILYSMNDLGITFKTSYKKSARIIGDVLGKYHPHGDSSVYDAMVRMAQPFSMRLQLVDGQGNYGSIDGDSAAAMRYTEARMGQIPSSFMFKDLDKEIVEFAPNYDGNEVEPTVLPLKYPNLLINGVQGIAVGMASDICPHNPIEVMEALKYKVNNRINDEEDSIDDLLRIMPAPDFPTGGYVHGAENMRDAWERGVGKVYLRSVWDVEEENGKVLLNIKEIPYLVNKQNLVIKLKELTKVDPESKIAKIEGVHKIEDYSDKDGISIQIVIKNEYDADMVMNELMAKTELQKSFNYNATVLVKEKGRLIPKQLGLNEILDNFIDFRLEVIMNRTILADKKLAAREHILNALRKAIAPENIEEVISTIRANKNTSDARIALMALLDIDEEQAEQVLQIRLSKLVGLEVENIDSEIEEILATRNYYKDLMENSSSRLAVILEESEDVITDFCKVRSVEESAYKGVKYPLRERLTEFQQEVIKSDLATMTKEEECNIILSADGFMRRVPITELTTMNRGARGRKQMELGKNDFVQLSINSHSHNSLMFVTNTGQCYVKPAYEITDSKRGVHVNRILELGDKEKERVIDVISVKFAEDELIIDKKEEKLIAMFTKSGLVKVSKLDLYASAGRKGGIKAVTLRDNDEILSAALCTAEDQIFMVNSANKIIRFNVSAVKIVGRTASGVLGMKLDKGVKVVGASVIAKSNDIETETLEDGEKVLANSGYIVCVSENGLIKVTKENQYRVQARNGKGIFAMKESDRSGQLFNAFFVSELEDEDVVFTTKKGYSNRRPLASINVTNRNTSGVTLTKLDEDDQMVDIFHAPHVEPEDEMLSDEMMEESVDMEISETEESESNVEEKDDVKSEDLESEDE